MSIKKKIKKFSSQCPHENQNLKKWNKYLLDNPYICIKKFDHGTPIRGAGGLISPKYVVLYTVMGICGFSVANLLFYMALTNDYGLMGFCFPIPNDVALCLQYLNHYPTYTMKGGIVRK